MKNLLTLIGIISSFIMACNSNESDNKINSNNETIITNSEMASIVSVSVNGKASNYTFNVGVSSPDMGCNQYADWWEVLTEDETLLYRRILSHSHVNEQPFIRSGGPIAINANQIVIVRAHMNTFGYGVKTFKGSVNSGFIPKTQNADFAKSLAFQAPTPSDCDF